MTKVLAGFAILISALFSYLLWWPVAIQPVRWAVSVAPGYTGPHAVNSKLSQLKTIALHGEVGPEHIAFGPDGKLYTTVVSGNILRMNADGSEQEVFANTGGRVLGFDFDAEGNMVAADAVKGLLAIAKDGKITMLADAINGEPIRYADAVVVAKSGKMYLSDASTRFAPKDWGGTFEASILDIFEQSATGRILEFDPAAKTIRVVAKGLSFANGVALSQDEQTLFVTETGRYRIWKIAVAAHQLDLAHPGNQASVLFDNLPGFPDNLMRGRDGKIWLGFAKPRNATADSMSDKPWLRKLTLRLPRALWPIPKSYGHVMAFSEDGKVLADLQDPSGAYPETTGVTETADRLYIHSLHAKSLGWVAK
jgi:sugar lactone lactonase YvrE